MRDPPSRRVEVWWLGGLLGATPGVAAAAETGTGFFSGAEVWLAGALIVAAGAGAWFAGRRAGRQLAQHARQLSSVLEFADCLLWQGKVTLLGDDWKWDFTVQPTGLSRRIFGQVLAPEVGGLWEQFNLPECEEMTKRCREALRSGRAGYEQEFHFVLEGKMVWLRESVSITRLGPDQFSLVGLVTEVTRQREMESARRTSEERLRQLLSRTDCMLWQARVRQRADGGTDWEWFIPDSELFRRVGGKREPVPQMPWSTTLVPEFAEICARVGAALRDGERGYEQEFRVVLANEVLWLHEQVSLQLIGPGEWRLEGFIVNITAQRQAEESKHASEAQLERVMQTADFMLWHARVFRTAGGELHWVLNVPRSTLYRRVFGDAPGESTLLPWGRVVGPEAHRDMLVLATGAIARGEAGYQQDIETRREGEKFWLHEQATVRAVSETEWQIVGIVTDVTTRHLAEVARQGSEQALREILERADCLLWRATVVRDGAGVKWAHFDLPESRLSNVLRGDRALAGNDWLWDRSEVPELAEMNARSTRAMLTGENGYGQEFRASRDGRDYWLHEQVTIIPVGADEWRLVGVITDVTERHEALEAQRKSEGRLEELLRRADCMIWQGRVSERADGSLDWKTYAPRSRLNRRIFGGDPGPEGFLWDRFGVPEFEEMRVRSVEALRGGAPGYEQVFHVPKPEGDIWLTEQVTILPAGPGQWDLVGVITDITASREADQARRATEAKLERILALADCMVWESNVTARQDGKMDWILYTPRSVLYRRLFGDDDHTPTLAWERLNVPELAEIGQRSLDALQRGAPGYEQEFRVVQLDRVVWLREIVTITNVGPGKFRLVGVITDITAQREAQAAHQASLAQVEQMLGGVDCLLWQGRVFEVAPGTLHWVMFIPRSRLYRELFGRDPASPATMQWAGILDPATEQEINARSARAIFGDETAYEQEFRAQRGTRVFWLHEHASVTRVGPAEWKVVGVMTDLTARRAAEQSVRASELRYRTLYQHTPVAIVEADFTPVAHWLDELRTSGVTDLPAWLHAEPARVLQAAKLVRILDCNDTAMAMLRARSKADFRRRRGVLATADSMRVVREVTAALWEGRNRLEAEIDMNDFEGGLHRVNLRWWMESEAGEVAGRRQSVLTLVDLTNLKQAEAALAAEKERLAVTLRAMAEGVITTDVQGRVQFLNEAAAVFAQCDARESIGRPVGEICCFENDRTGERVEVPVARVAQGDVVVDLPARTRMAVRGGMSRLVDGCCAPIHSATSRVIGTVLVFRDVTEHERLEQELVRATKLESVGILAGGIAHDFNNILTAVMGNVALAALDVDPQSDAGRCLGEAERATLRARDLTQQLLTFAKGGEPVRSAVRLDAVVREIATFTLHGSKVRAQFEVPAELWAADADKGQIGRVVQNLVLNAVQAMPDGGTVKIALNNEHVDGLTRGALGPGDYVRIEISDTGVGIKPEHLPRIFDPYFTTKQMGSGLGLAAVYSIVTKHRGMIDVASQLGSGTTFRLWLPASHDATAAGDLALRPQTVAMRGRVLFMDDEDAIRQLAAFLLRRFGFEVDCVVDGAAAVEKYRAALNDKEPYALVIMDLTVPGGMGGLEAVSRLREIDPKVRAIVSSGYSSDPVLANYRDHGFCGVVAKPYEMSDLARVLRDALAGPGG